MTECRPLPTLLVIPTGIGCALGGYAGDALPAARLLAAASGCLITHPNVMNGAALYWTDPRIHYVEGSALDRFAAAGIGLRPVRRQRLGLLLDAGIEAELRWRQGVFPVATFLGYTSHFGTRIGPGGTPEPHHGLDIAAPLGSPIRNWWGGARSGGDPRRPQRPAGGFLLPWRSGCHARCNS